MGLAKVDFDETFATVLLHDILPTAAPEFKKQTEDGPSKSITVLVVRACLRETFPGEKQLAFQRI